MDDIQTKLNVNFISDQLYDEPSLQLILLNIFGGNYNNFNFKITDGNKVTMEDSAVLINGQIYLFKGGIDLTDIIEAMPSGQANRINVFLIYDYDYDPDLETDIVSNTKLSLTNEGGGGQIIAPVGIFIKNDNDHTVEWIKESDDKLNVLLQSTLEGEIIQKNNLPENGWVEGDIITFPDNILKYSRFLLYPLSKNSSDPENPIYTNNMQIGVVPDSWENNAEIMCSAGYSNNIEIVTWQTEFDNYKNDTGEELLQSNQIRLKYYKSFHHGISGPIHPPIIQNDYIYKIIAKKY